MATLNSICKDVMESVDGAVAVGVVDLNSGMVLGIHHKIQGLGQPHLDVIGASSVDILRGRNISSMEEMVSSLVGRKVERTVTEIQMTTTHTYNFLAVLPNKNDSAVVLITDKTTNLGLGWARLRGALPKIEPLCP